MKIRNAIADDLSAIKGIWDYYILNTTVNFDYIPKTDTEVKIWFENKERAGFPVFVAEEGGEVLGYATFGPFRAWQGYQFGAEHGIYLKPDSNKKGYGRALLNELINSAKQMGFHTIVGAIEAGNSDSLLFHRNMGFSEVAHFKEIGFKFDQWLDCIFVQKML